MDAAVVDRVSAAEPDWRASARRRALVHFDELEMPSQSDEVWKYVSLDFDLDDYRLVSEPGPGGDGGLAGLTPARRVLVVDGIGTAASGADDGVWVGSLEDAMAVRAAVVEAAESRGVPADLDRFAAAHRAFGGGGALVHVDRAAVSGTVLVEFVTATPGAVSFPRLLVVTEDAAEASVIVYSRSEPGVDALVVPHVEVLAGAASNVSVSVIQNLGRRMRSIGHTRAVIGRDASLTFAEAGLGGLLSRLHLTVDLEGRGSSAAIVGAYFGDRDQILDYRYFMHHAGLDTRSDMFLKGAVEDTALSVFTGLIRIDEGAQRTDAFQTNRNLILSEGAAAQSVPNLEILANDVRCGHGSTVGPLDAEQRYYLMSRGIEPERADRLQVRGFFEEALARFPHREVVVPLREWMNAKFVEAQEEGRVRT